MAWSPRLHAWVVSRYDDIVEVVRDPETFSSRIASGPSSVTALARRLIDDPATSPTLRQQAERRLGLSQSPVLLVCDPPMHKRQRALVSRGFTPRRVGLMEPEVRRISTALIDAFIDTGSVELVSQFSVQLPMAVIAGVLGVPTSMLASFKRWSNAFTEGVGALEQSPAKLVEIFAAVDEFYDYFTEQIARRRAEPADDLLSDLIAARFEDEDPLSLDEILQMLTQFLVAGNETTANLLTNVAYELARNPELAARLRQDVGLIPPFVEEMLRLESPVQGLFRTATRDAVVGEVKVRAEENLFLLYASANRDAAAFGGQAGELVFDSDEHGRHLAFGRGEHFCIGASVARLEARVGLEELLKRLDRIRPAGELDEPRLHSSFVLRGLAQLPLTFDPGFMWGATAPAEAS